MRLPRFVLAAVLLISAAPEALGNDERIEAPRLAVGDRWERSNGRTYEVAGEDGDYYLVRMTKADRVVEEFWNKQTLTVEKSRKPGEKEVSVPARPPQQLLLFPVEVGKKWRFSYQRAYENASVTRWNQVDAWEEVTVPAGTFRAFRIRSEGLRTDTGYRFTEVYWYAPEVRGLIKATSSATDPRGREPMEFVLLKFTPGTKTSRVD